jgi:hypothetical protein
LPAIPASTERRHHIGIQAELNRLFGDFLPASCRATATAEEKRDEEKRRRRGTA